LCCAGLVLAAAACGKRGPPLPPLRPVPAAVADLALTRRGADVQITFTPPAANEDGTTPLRLDRVEIYAVTLGADEPAPPAAELRAEANRVASLEPAATPGPMQFAESVSASAGTRYYVVVPFATRSRSGPASPVLAVPLDAAAVAPGGVAISYDETTLTVKWTGAEGTAYRVYRDGAPASERLTAATFAQPVTFGTRVCFTVRAVAGTAPVAVESPASAAVCETPADTFAPAAPANLAALATEGVINLTWDAVTAGDLAGYLVLRAEAPGDRLQPLMTSPIAATVWADRTARAGVRYVYAVVAVDAAGNRSAESTRVEETGR
jgi:hypothetical protein